MTTHFTELAKAAAVDGKVCAEEVLALRRQGWGDGIIARDEAEALFALNNSIDERSQEWCDFFVEAISEFVLNASQPRLQCDDKEARWLIQQIDRDGVVDSMAELEAIVRVIERAENVPSFLKDYVIEQVEKAVLLVLMSLAGRCGFSLVDLSIAPLWDAMERHDVRQVVCWFGRSQAQHFGGCGGRWP